jgi:ATP-dependent Clp protease ATP-binding subunit ClpL
VNTNALISGDGYRGVIEKKFQDMISQAIAKKNVIFFFDEFHTVFNLGRMADGQTPGLANTLKPYLTRGDFRVIGATTHDEISQVKDKALLRRFSKQVVGEPDDNTMLAVIKNCFIKFIGASKIKVRENVFQQVYDLSLSLPGLNPDKSKDIVDLVVADCKMNEIDMINPEVISTTFDLFFKGMTIDDIKEEKEKDLNAENMIVKDDTEQSGMQLI